MKKFKWFIYDKVITKLFKKQIENEYNTGWIDGNAAIAVLVDREIDYWENWSNKKLLNQSKQILKGIKNIIVPL